jgi:bacterial microcompartment shell protein
MVTRAVPDPWIAARPAVASIEIASIARGIVALDQMAKRAETTIVAARTISPGRYLVVLSGLVAEIEEATDAGIAAAQEDLVDHVVLRDPHADLRSGIASTVEVAAGESLAIVETATVSSALASVDRALKGADVRLVELRLGAGLSGKGVYTLTGSLPMIEAAKGLVEQSLPSGRIVRLEVIAQPHPDLPRRLIEAEMALTRGTR